LLLNGPFLTESHRRGLAIEELTPPAPFSQQTDRLYVAKALRKEGESLPGNLDIIQEHCL